MKNILVPIDFSKQSMDALKVAIEIAKKTKGRVTLVHVAFLPVVYETGVAGQPFTVDSALGQKVKEDILKKLDKIISNSRSGVFIDSEVLFGDISASIIDAVEKYNSDLVVIGSSGVSDVSDVVIGSVNEKVVRHSPVPVLSVWEAFQPRGIKDILLPSTLDLDQGKLIKEVKKLQEFFNATLHILFVNTPLRFMTDREVEESFERFIRRYSITNCKTHMRNDRNETEGIINFAYNQRMNLIAMATHARTGLSRFFLESVTEDVVNKVTMPIWTYSLRAKN